MVVSGTHLESQVQNRPQHGLPGFFTKLRSPRQRTQFAKLACGALPARACPDLRRHVPAPHSLETSTP